MAHIADVIKYEGDNSTFIWKHPREDFNSLTQLIVHESQEAIFFMNGQALDLFSPGSCRQHIQSHRFELLVPRSYPFVTPGHFPCQGNPCLRSHDWVTIIKPS